MIDIDEFLAQSGLELHTVEQWITREWLLPDRVAQRTVFTEIDAARARLIRDLKADFGLNDEGVDIVLHLVDQIHGMRQALTEIRTELRITRRAPGRRPRAISEAKKRS